MPWPGSSCSPAPQSCPALSRPLGLRNILSRALELCCERPGTRAENWQPQGEARVPVRSAQEEEPAFMHRWPPVCVPSRHKQVPCPVLKGEIVWCPRTAWHGLRPAQVRPLLRVPGAEGSAEHLGAWGGEVCRTQGAGAPRDSTGSPLTAFVARIFQMVTPV